MLRRANWKQLNRIHKMYFPNYRRNSDGSWTDMTLPDCAIVEKRRPDYEAKPTELERRAAEREAQEKARRTTTDRRGHTGDCSCPSCKPAEWA